MDALKIISEGSIKAEKPQFNVGGMRAIRRNTQLTAGMFL